MSNSEYSVIKHPLVSEKLHSLSSKNIYGFEVSADATRVQVKRSIEKLYSVKVEKVNVLNVEGKKKRMRGKSGFTSAWKKAIVRLKDGQQINVV